jgi:hypothetical protein
MAGAHLELQDSDGSSNMVQRDRPRQQLFRQFGISISWWVFGTLTDEPLRLPAKTDRLPPAGFLTKFEAPNSW